MFQFNDTKGEFEELAIDESIPLYKLLDPDFILLFMDPGQHQIWFWCGSNTTTKMKFISAKIAPQFRDKYGSTYKILAIDDGTETSAFKKLIGLEISVNSEK